MKDKLTKEEFEKLEIELVTDFLKSATLEQRHQLVAEWNYDSGYEVLNWVADAKDTDKATILMMYWMMGPRFQKKFKDREDVLINAGILIEAYDFLTMLESRYIARYYQEQNIAFDPSNDIYTGEDWTTYYLDIKTVSDIPPEMFKKLDGKSFVLEDGWIEGMPQEIFYKIEELIDLIIDEEI